MFKINRKLAGLFFVLLFTSSCSSVTEYVADITAKDREDLVVYKRSETYEDTQFDLEVPPDLISPQERNTLDIPEFIRDSDIKVFTVDTKLENIELVRSGRDAILSLKNIDKKVLWDKLFQFWSAEGFRMSMHDYTLGTMKTVYLENLSEAQLGTIQKYVGRYIPLLVSPETRDSFKTRILERDEKVDVLITHYGKEYMSDGESEFRWQNRDRDPEIEIEMISRLFIYLGGDEAKSRGYTVIKSTGVRNKASLNVDENGIHTLFVADIYERVWPQTIRTLETMGIQIINAQESEGIILLSATEVEQIPEEGMLDFLKFWNTSTSNEEFNIILTESKNGVTLEIQDTSYAYFSNVASEEVLRALYADFR